MDEIRQTFFQECEDLLDELESGLLMVNEGYGDQETINAIFRAVHSIKGGAGAFGLDDLVAFAHIFETTLDEVRSDRLEATNEVLKILLQSSDMLADLVRAARDEEPCDTAKAKELEKQLEALVGTEQNAEAAPEATVPVDSDVELDENGIPFTPMTLDIDFGDLPEVPDESSETTFDITFKPKPQLYANGNEAAVLLRELKQLGTCKVVCDFSQIPDIDNIDPEGAYLSWVIELHTTEDEEAIREVFEFVDDTCELSIAPREVAEEAIELEAEPLPDLPATEVAASVEETASVNPAAETEPKPDAPAEKAVSPEPARKQPPKKEAAASQATIRVSLDRVDRLINLVGELVINQAMISQCVAESELATSSSVTTGLDEFKQLTREIQESVMAIRAQPVKSLFQRMSRIVREAAAATGKTVRLITDGEATEVDKTVIEKLADPLTHMIRNAVDHGLETPEKRLDSGKDEEGVVRLTASHRSGRIVIDITDDGAGINRERVKQIAIDKNLIPADAQLTDSEIDNLLFLPGFSTAKEVSNLSGRGVGMDVVKRSIQALGGRISISSNPGKGSTFTISLPLTLAVLDGMVVHVADQTMVVPLTAIVETLQPSEQDIHPMGADAKVISIRGEFVPMIDVGYELGYRGPLKDHLDGIVLSVETGEGARSALIVDAIQDQRQVVIKSLEDNYGHVPGIAAATILGDGRIALILDVDAVVARAGVGNQYLETPIAAAG